MKRLGIIIIATILGLAILLAANRQKVESGIRILTEMLKSPTETPTAAAAPLATPTMTATYMPLVTIPQGPFNLMPMGDSLVEGWYWVPTFFYDHKDACEFWMVGSHEGDNIWVPSREGHGGATTADYLEQQWHTSATAVYDPDVVLLMLGSNDYSNASINPLEVAGRLQQIVDEIHAVKQNTVVFVAIVSRDDANMTAYDAALQTMSDVVYVDQFSGFDPVTMTDDGVHPNELGSQQMADVYFAALQAAGYCP